MGYGNEQYGIDAYGSNAALAGLLGTFNIVSALPIATNIVRVTLSREPQGISEQLIGDALNFRTWKIVRLDTNVGFTVLSSTPVDVVVYDIRVLESLGSSNIVHRVSAPTLLDINGDPIGEPDNAEFLGILSTSQTTPDRKAASRKFAVRDLANPQGALPSGGTGGVYTIAKDGDYQLHEGTDFAIKQIFRRLMTVRGSYRFLPNFGVGLRVKEPLPAGDLISLQKEIEDQVKLETDVDKVRVALKQNKNQLTVVVQARLKATGQKISVPLPIPLG